MDLQALFTQLAPKRDENLLVGIEHSDDAGVYKISEEHALVKTADFITPITDDPYLYGQVAAANSLSDVYAMGGRPVIVLNLCCFPGKGIDLDTLGQILKGGLDKTQESGALLVGGHTVRDEELKYGLSVTGIVYPDQVTPNTGARVGDKLILTKPIGTGVHISGAKMGRFPAEKFRPVVETMATLNKIACEVMVELKAKGCTDITGFGLGGHALEMAKGSKVGLRIHVDTIPRFPDTMDLFEMGVKTGVTATNAQLIQDSIRFDSGINPLEQMLFYDPQTSGGLLISIAEDQAETCLKKLQEQGVSDAKIIGEVFSADKPILEIVR